MTTDPIFEIDIVDVSYFYWFKKTTELAVEPEPYNPFTFSLAKSYNEGDRYPTSLMDDSKGKIWTQDHQDDDILKYDLWAKCLTWTRNLASTT